MEHIWVWPILVCAAIAALAVAIHKLVMVLTKPKVPKKNNRAVVRIVFDPDGPPNKSAFDTEYGSTGASHLNYKVQSLVPGSWNLTSPYPYKEPDYWKDVQLFDSEYKARTFAVQLASSPIEYNSEGKPCAKPLP